MTLLRIPFGLAKYSGMLPSYFQHYLIYKVLILLNIYNAFNFIVPQCTFLFEHIDNFEESTKTLGALMNIIISASKIWIFLYHNNRLRELLELVGRFALDKTRTNYKMSKEADRLANRYSVVFIIVVYMAIVGVNCAPILTKLIEQRETGQVVKFRWELPFKSSYIFYDVNSSPFYEITYVVMAFSIFYMANCVAAADIIFLGLCLHICALLKDLGNGIIKELEIHANWTKATEQDFQNAIKSRIDYHNDICGIVKMLQSVFGGIFFSQFLGTICVLCTQAYLTTQNYKNGQILFNITFYTASAAQLFLYTYFGDLMTSQSEKLVNALTEVSWDGLQPKMRLYVRMMFLRSQKPLKVSLMNWIHCTIKSFQSVLMTSFNVFALLRSVAENK